MFISALGSISGSQNRLSLPKVHSAAVIMVDGLGSTNLKNAGGHAPFLNQILAGSKSISTGFPTTTAANLTSFATGRMPGEHGILGYSVFDRDRAATVNMLNGWVSSEPPRMAPR